MTGQRLLYEASDFPVFQNRMYDSAQQARSCPRGDIALVEDLRTGLVHNARFDQATVEYDPAYQNEQANSPSFRSHLEEVADLVCDSMGTERLIEVGCGKGTFLELLAHRGADISGFDPTYEGDDPHIEKTYFGPGIGVNADGLILRHVLEHIPDPVDFLRQIARANDHRGLIYIEVPSFEWICDHRAWFDIFYEHVNYFRLSDFGKLFGRIVAMGTSFGEQYMYVIGDLATLEEPIYDPHDSVDFPDDFMAGLAADATTPSDVVWGGASKGLIYSMLRARAGRPVAGVIDINPAKQGKFLAGTGMQISAPADLLPTLPSQTRIMIMNPNYTEEIRYMSKNSFDYVEVGT